jgi:ascorbate-specific PTS system EIIC-type component UlaA
MATSKKSIADKVTDTATENLKLPVTFKEFSKNPVVGTLFIVLVAIGYLYIDVRSTFQNQGKSQDLRIEKLENRVDIVSQALRRSDSISAVSNTKLSTLEQLGKIQNIK